MVMAGIDVSGWNGVINFENVAKSKQFVIIKAGCAESTVDTYETNYKNAKAAVNSFYGCICCAEIIKCRDLKVNGKIIGWNSAGYTITDI